MIEHVYRKSLLAGAQSVIVATDDERIVDVVEKFGGEVMLTHVDHHSGTDRIEEVARNFEWDDDAVVVNVQGDEPFLPVELIRQVARDLIAHDDASVSTLCSAITDKSTFFDPHVVKVVRDMNNYALYFSRAPIPWHRDEFSQETEALPEMPAYRHIGLYAYRVGLLKRFVNWAPAEVEKAESLEQLRIMAHGDRIVVSEALIDTGHGIDTPEDLENARRLMATTA